MTVQTVQSCTMYACNTVSKRRSMKLHTVNLAYMHYATTYSLSIIAAAIGFVLFSVVVKRYRYHQRDEDHMTSALLSSTVSSVSLSKLKIHNAIKHRNPCQNFALCMCTCGFM